MGRNITLWLPDDLDAAVAELPEDFNLSALFQKALADKLHESSSCRHATVECTTCGRVGSPGEFT